MQLKSLRDVLNLFANASLLIAIIVMGWVAVGALFGVAIRAARFVSGV